MKKYILPILLALLTIGSIAYAAVVPSQGQLISTPNTHGLVISGSAATSTLYASTTIDTTNFWTGFQSLNAGAHVEQTQNAATTSPSNNVFLFEGGCDGGHFSTGDVLQLRVRSYRVINGVQYGSSITSNTVTHTFLTDACVDASFDADDYATVDGYVVEFTLNGSDFFISGSVGNISPASGTLPYHMEGPNGNPQALLATQVTQSVELGNYYDPTTNRFYPVFTTGPIKASTIYLDSPLPVSSGGTGKSDGTIGPGSQTTLDFYNAKAYAPGTGLFLDFNLGLIYDPTSNDAQIDLINHTISYTGTTKYNWFLNELYGNDTNLRMQSYPTFEARTTTSIGFKVVPNGAGYVADMAQFRNTNDSANNSSINFAGSLVARKSTAATGTAPIYFNTTGSQLTIPIPGALQPVTDKLLYTIQTGSSTKELTMNDNALTSGRIPFTTTNGRLTDSPNLTFNGLAIQSVTGSSSTTTIPGVLFTQSAQKVIANSNTETSAIGTGVGSMTLGANFWTAGRTVHIAGKGVYGTKTLTPGNVTVKIKLGSTILDTTTVNAVVSSASKAGWDFDEYVTCQSISSNICTFSLGGGFKYAAANPAATNLAQLYAEMNNSGDLVTASATTSQLLDVTITWTTADVANISTTTAAVAEVKN